MTRVWLVRHATTDWTGRRFCGRTDVPLSAEGIGEAEALGARLATEVPDDLRVVASPAARAIRTAELLVAALPAPVPIEVDHRLAEVEFGEAEGLTFAELERTMPALADQILAGQAVDWPGGESAAAIRDRARGAWLDAARDGVPRLAVTHGGLIRALLDVAVGRPALAGRWIGPAEAVELAQGGDRWQVVTAPPTAKDVA